MPDPTPAPQGTVDTPAPDPTKVTPAPAPAPAPAAGDGAPAPAPAPAAAWGDDWRERIAKGDEKRLGVFKRYNSPEALGDALIAAQQRISSGEIRQPLPANATPEQIAAYRQANGIPETPNGYLEKLPAGLIIGEDDKPLVTDFATFMHGKNLPPAAVHAGIEWYNQLAERQIAENAEAENAAKQQTEDTLRAEWGGEYRMNTNGVTNFLTATVADDSLREQIQGAIATSPNFAKWVANLARQDRPDLFTTIVPAGASVGGQGNEERIAEIEKLMRTNRKAYDKDETLQKELRDRYDARARLKQRGAA